MQICCKIFEGRSVDCEQRINEWLSAGMVSNLLMLSTTITDKNELVVTVFYEKN